MSETMCDGGPPWWGDAAVCGWHRKAKYKVVSVRKDLPFDGVYSYAEAFAAPSLAHEWFACAVHVRDALKWAERPPNKFGGSSDTVTTL